MAKVKVIVDSSSDLPRSLAQELGIVVVPMPVNLAGRSFREGVDLTTEEFYPRFRDLVELPKTAQPNLQDLINCYRQAGADGSKLLAIHLSSGLSGTVQTANLAREMLQEEREIVVVDSLGASLGTGMLAMRAAERAREGTDLAALAADVEEDKRRMRYVFTPDTLEYLIKGGRVSKVSGMVGTLLDIKPLLQLTAEGKIESIGKIRGRKPALRKLAEIAAAHVPATDAAVVGIAHAMCPEDAEVLENEIRERVNVKEILHSEIGCVIGSHTGPGCVALFYRC